MKLADKDNKEGEKKMSKIKDNIDLKELEKFGFTYYDKKEAKICYYRSMPLLHRTINILIEIYKDRMIDFQLPIGCTLEKNTIILNDYIQDLIQARISREGGINMSKADEMFKKIGYDAINLTTKIDNYININDEEDFKYIRFYNKNKTFKAYNFKAKDSSLPLEPKEITIQELQAIYQKCKELGWIE